MTTTVAPTATVSGDEDEIEFLKTSAAIDFPKLDLSVPIPFFLPLTLPASISAVDMDVIPPPSVDMEFDGLDVTNLINTNITNTSATSCSAKDCEKIDKIRKSRE